MEPTEIEPGVHDAAVLLAAGTALGEPKQIDNKYYTPYAVVPKEYELVAVEQLELPHRRSGTVTMLDARSFSEFYKRYAADSLIYASLSPAQFIAVFNDHTAGAPDWRDHRAVFQPKHSEPWNTWMKRNGPDKAFMGNVEFAEWLEDQSLDVVEPTGAAMMTMALSFRATESAKYSKAASLQDGSVTFEYDRTVEGSSTIAGGKAKIPERFTIEIPVFDGPDEPAYQIEARFRYRLVGGGLKIWYQLERPQLVMETAFKEIWSKIEMATQASILYGMPDA